MCWMVYIKRYCLLCFCIYICHVQLCLTKADDMLNDLNFDSFLTNMIERKDTTTNTTHSNNASSDTHYSFFWNMYCVGIDTYNPKETLKNIIPTFISIFKIIGLRNCFWEAFSRFTSLYNYMTGGVYFSKFLFWKVHFTVMIDYHFQKCIYINYDPSVKDSSLGDIEVLRLNDEENNDKSKINLEGNNNDLQGNNNDLQNILQIMNKQNSKKKPNVFESITYKEIYDDLNGSKYISLDLSSWQFALGFTFMNKPGGLHFRLLSGCVISQSKQVYNFAYYNGSWYSKLEDGMLYLSNYLSKMLRDRRFIFLDICCGYNSWEVVFSIALSHFHSDEQGKNILIFSDNAGGENVDNYRQKHIFPISISIRKIVYDIGG